MWSHCAAQWARAAEIPAATLFGGFPFGPDAAGYLAWFDGGNGRKLYQEMYDQAGFKVHVIPCAFGGGEAGGWFAKEITAKKDLEGLRMRIFGLGARVMSRVGVVPVLVPGGALPKAFDKGDIDAAELYTPAVDREQGLVSTIVLEMGGSGTVNEGTRATEAAVRGFWKCYRGLMGI